MQRAKEAIGGILGKDGHHDTTIEKNLNAPVTQEQVHHQQTSNTTTAVDREVHSTHHQTVVQPVHDRQVLPEKHHHNIAPVERHEHHHGKDHDVDHQLHSQAAQFKDTKDVLPTQHHTGNVKVKEGEHHHHHVKQNVQPVVQKERVQPHVVHNVVPVHEVVHNEPVVHNATVNPAMTMDEFKRSGGKMEGKEHYDYSGNPMNVDKQGHVTRGDHRYDGSDVPRTTGSGAGTGTGLHGHDHHHHDKHDNLNDQPHLGAGAAGHEHQLRDTMRDNDTSSDRVRNDAHERGGLKGIVDKLTGK